MITEQQTQQIIDAVQGGITQLSESMGVALPHLWEVLIRQQYVSAIQHFIFVVIYIVSTSWVIKFFRYGMRRSEEDHYSFWDVGVFFCGFIWLVTTFFALSFLSEGVGLILNPEYYALKAVAEFIRPAVQ